MHRAGGISAANREYSRKHEKNLQEKSVFDFLCVYTYICSYAAFVF